MQQRRRRDVTGVEFKFDIDALDAGEVVDGGAQIQLGAAASRGSHRRQHHERGAVSVVVLLRTEFRRFRAEIGADIRAPLHGSIQQLDVILQPPTYSNHATFRHCLFRRRRRRRRRFAAAVEFVVEIAVGVSGSLDDASHSRPPSLLPPSRVKKKQQTNKKNHPNLNLIQLKINRIN